MQTRRSHHACLAAVFILLTSFQANALLGQSVSSERASRGDALPAPGQTLKNSQSTGVGAGDGRGVRGVAPSRLPQPQPDSPTHPGDYLLGPGDTLAIIVHGVLGNFGEAPTHFPSVSQPDLLPASGYPVQIQGDGTLHLPQLDPLYVAGLNVVQTQEVIDAAYVQAGITNQPHMVMISLLRKRQVRATVVHSSNSGSRAEYVKLDADHATVLSAVAAGGHYDPHASVRVLRPPYSEPLLGAPRELADGSVVQLQSPQQGFFFTGGLLAGGQFGLPLDRDLNALQAIGVAGGFQAPLLGPHRLLIIPRGGPAISIPYRQLLNDPNAYPVQPGDQLILE